MTMIAYTNETYLEEGEQLEVIGEVKEYKQELKYI